MSLCFRAFDVCSPFFQGEVAIRRDLVTSGTVTVDRTIIGERTLSPIGLRHRPPLAQDPLRLIPLAVGCLLREWCPGRTAQDRERGYLAWSAIFTLMKMFRPVTSSFDMPAFASLRREVRRYQHEPALRTLVSKLHRTVVPAICHAIAAR
jgi:hypothetical protein